MIRLITRGDDAGSNVTANRAIRDACVEGVLRNVSVMMPCDAVRDAVDRLNDLEHVCLGLHATLNAEWSRVRWGSVSDPSSVPTIVQPDGTFFQTVPELETNGATVEHAMTELRAQLDRGRDLGFDFKYVDQHMGFGRAIPGFEDAFERWCEEESMLNFRHYHRRLDWSPVDVDDEVAALISALERTQPGQWAIVGHPAYDTDEMRLVGNDRSSGEEIAESRVWQRRWFMDPRIVDYFASHEIEAIRYDEAERLPVDFGSN